MKAARVMRTNKRKAEMMMESLRIEKSERDPIELAREVIRDAVKWDWAQYRTIEAFQGLVNIFEGSGKLTVFDYYIGAFLDCGKSAIKGSSDADISPVVVFVTRHLPEHDYCRDFLFNFVVDFHNRVHNSDHIYNWYRAKLPTAVHSPMFKCAQARSKRYVELVHLYFPSDDPRPIQEKFTILLTEIVLSGPYAPFCYKDAITAPGIERTSVEVQRDLVCAILVRFMSCDDKKDMTRTVYLLASLDRKIDVYTLSKHMNLQKEKMHSPHLLPSVCAINLACPWFPENYVNLRLLGTRIFTDNDFFEDLGWIVERYNRYDRFMKTPHWLRMYISKRCFRVYEREISEIHEHAAKRDEQLRQTIIQDTCLCEDTAWIVASYW